jgi:hypothetical protein
VPTVDQLRRGARIHSLLFAARLAKGTDRPYDVAWEGLRFRRSERDGSRGAISFSKLGVVALFYDPKSKEGPLELKKAYKLEAQLKGMPPQFAQHLKRETVFDAMEVDIDGKFAPVVTAAFWSERDGSLKGPKPWDKLIEDGAHLIATELTPPEDAADAFAQRYALSSEQAAVAKRLFAGSAAKEPSNARVVLPEPDRATLGILMTPVVRELLEGAGVQLA